MNDFTGRVRRDEAGPPEGFKRTVTLAMDTAQYQLDMAAMAATAKAARGGAGVPEDLYGTFNLVMRYGLGTASIQAGCHCMGCME